MAHGVPTSAELVDAVSEFLREDVLPNLSGRPKFDLRVSLNVLDGIMRELEDRGAYAATHAVRLAELGVESDEELAVAIRSGRLDDRLDELITTFRADTRERLAIANPKHLVGGDAG
jgi:hypothetical protein